jgi:hypothetical protein
MSGLCILLQLCGKRSAKAMKLKFQRILKEIEKYNITPEEKRNFKKW